MDALAILSAPDTVAEIRRHMHGCYPEEGCGVVTPDGFVALANRHPEPTKYFDCGDDAAEFQIRGTLLAVVHSHVAAMTDRVRPTYPSAMDMQSQVDMDCIWGLCVATEQQATEPWYWGPGIPAPDLIGRKFRHGPSGSDGRGDCYALIRDYYAIAHGIELPEFPRSWNWWTDESLDLYETGFAQAGFERVPHSDVRIGDVALVTHPITDAQGRALRPRAIHGAIYVGDGQVLQHKLGRLSLIEPLGGWNEMVKHWVRHVSKR
jgi:proteasome lid subunit RPN8/RPN11